MKPAISPVLAQLLVDPANEGTIRRTLLAYGWPTRDVEDGRQDVFMKAVKSFHRGTAPANLDEMRMFCAKIARDHAIDALKRAAKRERDFVGNCDPDEYCPLEYGVEQRDPVDAGRQLEVLGKLFDDGKMPADGVEILHEVASGTSCREIGEDLGISERAVRGRLDTMRKVYRKRMVELWMWPGMDLLRVIPSGPAAIAPRRKAA